MARTAVHVRPADAATRVHTAKVEEHAGAAGVPSSRAAGAARPAEHAREGVVAAEELVEHVHRVALQ